MGTVKGDFRLYNTSDISVVLSKIFVTGFESEAILLLQNLKLLAFLMLPDQICYYFLVSSLYMDYWKDCWLSLSTKQMFDKLLQIYEAQKGIVCPQG